MADQVSVKAGQKVSFQLSPTTRKSGVVDRADDKTGLCVVKCGDDEYPVFQSACTPDPPAKARVTPSTPDSDA